MIQKAGPLFGKLHQKERSWNKKIDKVLLLWCSICSSCDKHVPHDFKRKQRELVYRSWSSTDNQYKGHDLNIASLALSKLPFGILTFSQFSLKVMQNGSKDVCCLSGRGQLQTDRELSTPNCHTARSTRSLPSQFTEPLGTTNLVVWKGCNMAKFITNSVCYFQSSIV